MRFIAGILVALIFVLALIIFTLPKTPPNGGTLLANGKSASNPQSVGQSTQQQPALEVGPFELDMPRNWITLTKANVQAIPELDRMTQFFDREAKTRVIANGKEFKSISGFAVLVPLGRSDVTHLEAIRRVQKKTATGAGLSVVWQPRTTQVGAFDAASFAVKMQVPGTIGNRAMQVTYYTAGQGRRNILIITMKTLGSSGASDLQKMLDTLRLG